jgi:hypothetical protein
VSSLPRFSFHTFEYSALAQFVAVVVAHTRATEPDRKLDTRLNRLLAEHGITSIDDFDQEVGRCLDDLEQTRPADRGHALDRPGYRLGQ